MNIVMFSNTYIPHVGGVSHSVQAFARQYQTQGHQVLIVVPEFDDGPQREKGVIRIPAIQRFNHSDFSVVLPVSGLLSHALNEFKPDIVHAHHPYLLGMTALRVARYRNLPLVFTHHTLYEKYTHYLPGDSRLLQRFVIELATQYANMASAVFAPSNSIRQLMKERGVQSTIHVVPTGVDVEQFQQGNGLGFRERYGISEDVFLVGHVGRLAPEKNLHFLAGSVAEFIARSPESLKAGFLVVGTGPEEKTIRRVFSEVGLDDRLITPGALPHSALADAYCAMNVFAFASTSETQGLVLTEAMAAGLPVVALDGPGVREVVVDQRNGRLLSREDSQAFANALRWVSQQNPQQYTGISDASVTTAKALSVQRCAGLALGHYQKLIKRQAMHCDQKLKAWEHLLSLIKAELEIIESFAESTVHACSRGNTTLS